MEALHEALRLLKHQAEIENSMRRPGGIRVTRERELHQLREALTKFPAAVAAIIETAACLHRPIDALCVDDVERVTESDSHETAKAVA